MSLDRRRTTDWDGGNALLPSPPSNVSEAGYQARGLSFIACERGDRPSLRTEFASRVEGRGQRPFAMNLFVGPEGGYTDSEIDAAINRGIIPIGLGPRILRAETASIVGSTLLLACAGDLY